MKNSIIHLPVIEAVVVQQRPEHLTSLPNTRMFTKKRISIGVVTVFCVAMIALAMIPRARSETVKVPDEAWTLANMIQEKSDKYTQEQAALQPLLDQIAKLEGARDNKLNEMGKLSGGASGLDHSLCVEYGLKYVRGNGKSGTFVNVTDDCPLE